MPTMDFSKAIYSRPDGSFVATVDGAPYHILPTDPLMVQLRENLGDYLAVMPPEPGPSPEVVAARRRMAIGLELAALDARRSRPTGAIVNGTGTDEDRATLAGIELEAEALRTELRGLS